MGYVGYEYTIFAGMMGMKVKLLVSYYMPFVYREEVLGLIIQLRLGWSS